MSLEYEKTALLALPGIKPGVAPEAGLLSWSRPYLIEQVRAQGVDVLVSRGIGAINEETAQVEGVVRPEYASETSVSLTALGRIGLDEVNVVRNIVRPVRADTATPFLNENSIRDLARNKLAVAETVLGPAGVYHRKSISTDGGNTNLEVLHGDTVVAKPIGGQRSRGVFVGSKHEAADFLQSTSEPYMVEEKLDFTQAFPSLRGSTDGEQSRLDYANASGVNKELRMYYFGDGQWDAVGRVAKPGETDFSSDKWLYLDLDSIPSSIIEGGTEVVRKLHRITGTDEFNIALDWVYASSASRPEASWQVMELNAAEPQLVRLEENEDVGRRQHQKLAKQISRIALS